MALPKCQEFSSSASIIDGSNTLQYQHISQSIQYAFLYRLQGKYKFYMYI